MSDSSAPPADRAVSIGAARPDRRRALGVLGAALLGAALTPALRARAASVAAAKPVFGAGSLAEVLSLLDARPTPSADVLLDVPDFVENGALVPVEITSHVRGTEEIYIVSEANPFPLVARFSVQDGTEAFVSTRIKVASSCNILALIRANGEFFSASKATTVTVGGCGA
jgi:sulfur-oxidizing protein SoxY